MRRLDGTSALMIYGDAPRRYQHTLKIAILDFSECESGYHFELIRNHIQKQVDGIPILKWKVARVPFGLNHPCWVQDLEFDLSHHVRRIACPAPGDNRAFCQLVSELYAQNLNQNLPLWTVWVVEGLEDGKVALVNLLHHAYTDGVGASMMLERLASNLPQPDMSARAMGVDPNRNPSSLRLFLQGCIDLPLMFIRNVPPLVRDIRTLKKLQARYKQEGRQPPPSAASSPYSPLLNAAEYSHNRTFYYETYDLAEFKAVANAFGATINDLLLAIISGALRSWHLENQIKLDKPLVAIIPMNLRGGEQRNEILGNLTNTSNSTLSVHLDDPLERLDHVRESASNMKEYAKATRGIGITRASELLPPFVTNLVHWIVRRSKGHTTPFGTITISNVPGPRKPLYVSRGVKICDWISIGQLAMGMSLNITAWSYVGRLNISLMSDKNVVPVGEDMLAALNQSYQEYVALQKQRNDEPLDQPIQNSETLSPK